MTPAEITEAHRLIADSLMRFQSRILTGAGDTGPVSSTGMCGASSAEGIALANLAARALGALEADEARAALRQAIEVLSVHDCCDKVRAALAAAEKALSQQKEKE